MCIAGSSLSRFVEYNRTESIFDEMCYTLSDQMNRVAWGSTIHDDWLPYGDSTTFYGFIYVDPSLSSTSTSCGVKASPCSSISESIKSSYYGRSEFREVVLMEGTHQNDKRTIDVGENTLPIRNYGEVEFDVPSSFSSTSSVFSISNGILNMNGFVIEMKKTIGSGCSFVYVNGGGSVILNSMSISGGSSSYATSNTPLLDIGSGSISCDNVTFENITRLSGNGTIFEFTSLSTSFTLSGMTFNNCRCLSGNGGVIYVTLSSNSYLVSLYSLTFVACSASIYGGGVFIDGGEYISTSSLSFSSLSFTSCSATSYGGSGMCIAGSSLSRFVEYNSWNTLVPSSYSSSYEGIYV